MNDEQVPKMPIPYSLEPIDPDDPLARYRAVVQLQEEVIDQRSLAEALVAEGLPTDVDTVLALMEAEQAAVASLMWEGWDVEAPGCVAETPWPHKLAPLLGGTRSERVTAGEKRLIQRMRDHGTPHTRSQIGVFFIAQRQVIVRLLLAGHEIQGPLAWIQPVISGVFRGPDDEYDPRRHEISTAFENEPALTHWLEGYRELDQRGLSGAPRPLLDGYEVFDTDWTRGDLTPGSLARLRGYWLRFWQPDPRQGILFLAEDGSAVRQEATAFHGLNEVLFLVPDLLPGSYWLEVRTIVLPRDGLQRSVLPGRVPVVAKGGG